MLRTENLYHGGIMVNYRCSAACRHCLYACSPTRGEGYISVETMREVCKILRRGSIGSVHIGGGEPFLNFEGLLMAIRELRAADIDLDYVETNAFWAEDEKAAIEKLKALGDEGVQSLCISLDPFHAEYVPYGLPLKLVKLCDDTGMGCFLWKKQFLSGLTKLDRDLPHSRTEMEAQKPGYIDDAARDYGLRIGGRAINIEEEYGNTHTVAELLDKVPACPDLLSTGHFHVDQDGCFIPPGCTGIRLPLAEVVDGIPDGKYPVFEALYETGIGALMDLAQAQGFVPAKTYASRCNLCFHTREFLAGKGFAELDANHYEESLKYYNL